MDRSAKTFASRLNRPSKLNPVDREIAQFFDAPVADARAEYRRFLDSPPDALMLAKLISNKRIRKYDRFLSEELLDLALSTTAIDVPAALDVIGRSRHRFQAGHTIREAIEFSRASR